MSTLPTAPPDWPPKLATVLKNPPPPRRHNACPKCGAEMTKLVSCPTCNGNVMRKTCPNCPL